MTELPAGKFGETSYLYHHNVDEKRLEYVGEFNTVYDRVTMNLTHCSSYVLTDVRLPASDHVVYPSEHQHEYKVVDEKPAVEIPATGTTAEPSDSPTDTNTPTGGQTGDTTSPQTGDNNDIALWIAVMLAAGTALIGIVLYSHKRKYS